MVRVTYDVEPVSQGFQAQVFVRGEAIAVSSAIRDYDDAVKLAKAMAGVKSLQLGGTKNDVYPA